MTVLSPIKVRVSSPSYFKSYDSADITVPGKILQFLTIRAPSIIVTFGPTQVPSPISTLAEIELKGSIIAESAIFASGWIYAKLCFMVFILNFIFGYQCHHFCFYGDGIIHIAISSHMYYASSYRLYQFYF